MKVITFGRNDNNDVIINDQFVGRKHCQIVENDGKLLVVDLNSKNGTYVNGKRITGQQPLSMSDEIRIGQTTLNWQIYFSQFPTPLPYPMRTISIGRSSSNDVTINDSLVTREQHCLITEENGHYYIFDANSKNGTYVNGSRIPNAEKIRLHHGDVVRIGNTVLPWQSYFKTPDGGSTSGGSDGASGYGGSSDGGDNPQQPTTTALQAIALVLSLIGLCFIGYVAIKIMSWSIFGYAFNYTIGLVGAGCSLIALILAEIAEYQEKTDNTTMATIAEWISSACLFTVVAFFIYWKINPDFLNPFH